MTAPAIPAIPADPRHAPVMRDEVIAALAPARGETHLDGTFGAGGYTRALLASAAHVIAIDQDPDAIAGGQALVTAAGGALTLVEGRFSALDIIAADAGCAELDGVTLDIGVSSMQLDQADRGFAFMQDGPLNMLMAQSGETAAEWIDRSSEEEIADTLYRFGEERQSRRVARAIVAARPLTRTAELAAVVRKALGYHPGAPKDPATRSFQAIRIAVNNELGELERGLEAAERALKPGGRIAIVTFHSLEDRIVKAFLRNRSGGDPSGSRHLPAQAASTSRPATFGKIAKPIKASEAELARNPRARSATLRSATRTAAAPWTPAAPHRSIPS